MTGGLAVALPARPASATVAWSLPTLAVPEMAFSGPAFIAVPCPMVVLALGLGNAQGLGFLLAQGYLVRVRAVTVAVGVHSVLTHGSDILEGRAAHEPRQRRRAPRGPSAQRRPCRGRYSADDSSVKLEHPPAAAR